MKRQVALIIMMFAVLTAACGFAPNLTAAPTATIVPTDISPLATNAAEVVGAWKKKLAVGAPAFLQFKEDGTMIFARGMPENLESQPFREATFAFEGTQLLIQHGSVAWPSPDKACLTETAIYEAQLLTSGDLRLVAIEDSCRSQEAALSAEWTRLPPPANFTVEFVSEITGDPNRILRPGGIDIDRQGNLHVADGGNNRVQVLDSSGNFLRMWGSEGDGDGQFNMTGIPELVFGAVAVDDDGNIYVADTVNARIQKFSAEGQFLAKWGGVGNENGQFLRPVNLEVDDQGNVYVIDNSRQDIQKFDRMGKFLTKWGGPGPADGQFTNPAGLTVDSEGNVYVADTGNHRVQKFDSNGVFLSKWGSKGKENGQLLGPIGLAVDAENNVYVLELDGNRVQIFDGNGQFLFKWGSTGLLEPGKFNFPYDIAVDGQGNIYVSDHLNQRIQKFRLVKN